MKQINLSSSSIINYPPPSRSLITNAYDDTNGTYSWDSGSTAWMLTSTALVLFMTLPGLILFYVGMVRTKNVVATCMQVSTYYIQFIYVTYDSFFVGYLCYHY
jgi:hypothetical protein